MTAIDELFANVTIPKPWTGDRRWYYKPDVWNELVIQERRFRAYEAALGFCLRPGHTCTEAEVYEVMDRILSKCLTGVTPDIPVVEHPQEEEEPDPDDDFPDVEDPTHASDSTVPEEPG